MKLIGLMPVRNEDWVLGLSARVALQWCDELHILMHDCTDGTAQIVADLHSEFPGRIGDVDAAGPWDEMRHRQRVGMDCARLEGATHIAMIDADEVLTATLLLDLGVRSLVAGLTAGEMLELPGYNLRGSLNRYHSNGIWGNRWFSCAFKDQPEAHWAGDKFHSRNPAGVQWKSWRPIQQGEGGILHLWGASERRLRAKHAAYKVTERLRFPAKPTADIERMYNLWRSPNDCAGYGDKNWTQPWTFADVPLEWWMHPPGVGPRPHYCIGGNPTVWQEAEVRRLVEEHGREKFQGLDLFGVA